MDDYGDATLHPEPANEGSQVVLKGFASDAALQVIAKALQDLILSIEDPIYD